ncbi:MAG TPA: methyl-accepting chemotaxis protein, partial [Candidatus Dormibacteraeota bacterium]|nr:methyl-accepting chemotaxis protein [Candidatus Dormibacteraeota bacterium]
MRTAMLVRSGGAVLVAAAVIAAGVGLVGGVNDAAGADRAAAARAADQTLGAALADRLRTQAVLGTVLAGVDFDRSVGGAAAGAAGRLGAAVAVLGGSEPFLRGVYLFSLPGRFLGAEVRLADGAAPPGAPCSSASSWCAVPGPATGILAPGGALARAAAAVARGGAPLLLPAFGPGQGSFGSLYLVSPAFDAGGRRVGAAAQALDAGAFLGPYLGAPRTLVVLRGVVYSQGVPASLAQGVIPVLPGTVLPPELTPGLRLAPAAWPAGGAATHAAGVALRVAVGTGPESVSAAAWRLALGLAAVLLALAVGALVMLRTLAARAASGERHAAEAQRAQLAALEASANQILLDMEAVTAGDLTVTPSLAKAGELAAIADSIGQVILAFRGVASTVREAVDGVRGRTAALSGSVDRLSETVNAQQHLVSATRGAWQGIDDARAVVSEGIGRTRQAADQTMVSIDAGHAAVARTLEQTDVMQGATYDTLRQLKTLSDAALALDSRVEAAADVAGTLQLVADNAHIRAASLPSGFEEIAEAAHTLAEDVRQRLDEIQEAVALSRRETVRVSQQVEQVGAGVGETARA